MAAKKKKNRQKASGQQMPKPKQPRQILPMVLTGLLCLLLLIAYLCFFSAKWYVDVYGRIGFDSVLYTLASGTEAVSADLISDYLLGGALPALIWWSGSLLFLFFPIKQVLRLKLFSKERRIFPLSPTVARIVGLVLSLGLIVYAAWNVELIDYINAQIQGTELYQKEYRDPKEVQITFPEEKRNLVYIVLESMETSYLSTDQGGALEHNLIPELFDLAQENINFSHNETVGGFRQITGASWTVGSLVAQSGGVPLKVPDGIADQQNGYGQQGEFLPGLTTLQSILHENGYYQAMMFGSDARYAGRKTYFTTHGVDQIYDLFTARSDGLIPEDYRAWWGFEDLYLFSYAKDKLTEIAAQEQPFAFLMLTADTHHVGGYPCRLCIKKYSENYDNVISCSSAQTAKFIAWLTEQPFYENTTVIIVGDHNSMDAGYFKRNVAEDYQRHIYNCFINSAADATSTANRQFTAMDLFPSTLAAMGCTIEGDRLGFGTNLFSGAPTLLETYGYDAFAEELSKRTYYYNRFYED